MPKRKAQAVELKKANFDYEKAKVVCEKAWTAKDAPGGSIVDRISEYIEIPNQSPAYDAEWATNGLQEKAVKLMVDWVNAQKVPGMTVETVTLPGRTPLIFLEVPSTASTNTSETVLMYGHMDKQPPMLPWAEGMGPWKPVMKDGKLYGRGGADDGYAVFAAVTAIQAVKAQGLPHSRIVTIIEGCEESGSFDLPFYVDHLKERIGTPSLIVCLDSGCANYDQLWVTTSLRGMVFGTLTVKILTEGVHSGMASGIVPSSFRIARMLLNRIEDVETGEITLPELKCKIPDDRLAQIAQTAETVGKGVFRDFPWEGKAEPTSQDFQQLHVNRTWSATLSTVAAGGFAPLSNAGNVLRPETALGLSIRIPPTVNPKVAAAAVKKALEANPPYGATVTFESSKAGPGWNAPAAEPWLQDSLDNASKAVFGGNPACYMGEGGSIPFMGMLGEKFPNAQFFITGVLGPKSNAHGPNEYLETRFAAKLTACVSSVLANHCSTFCS